MTLRHVVAWKLATEDPTERAAQAQKIADDLNALAGVVPEIESIAVGPDVVGGANWDVVLVADFADLDALARYVVHPSHEEAAKFVRSVALPETDIGVGTIPATRCGSTSSSRRPRRGRLRGLSRRGRGDVPGRPRRPPATRRRARRPERERA